MYPIHSLLRRFASTVIYAERESRLNLDSNVKQLHVKKGVWVNGKDVVIYEVVAQADTAAQAAQKLSLWENEIAKKIGAEDYRYTIVLGPEDQVVLGDGSIKRIARLAILNGIFRYRKGIVERLKKRSSPGAVSRRKHSPPPGALIEKR